MSHTTRVQGDAIGPTGASPSPSVTPTHSPPALVPPDAPALSPTLPSAPSPALSLLSDATVEDAPVLPRRVVILGVGNPLYGDDGFGIEAVARFLAEHVVGPEVEIIDGGTEGLGLLGYIEEATELIIIDVVEGGQGAPGQLVEFDAVTLASGSPLKLSQHQVGVEEVLGLAVWRGRLPVRSVLLGVVPQRLELGLGLSPVVASTMDAVLSRVEEVLEAWEVPCARTF